MCSRASPRRAMTGAMRSAKHFLPSNVAAIPRSVRLDLTGLGKCTMSCARCCLARARRPGRAQRHATGGRGERVAVGASTSRRPPARHDPHADRDVGRVGELTPMRSANRAGPSERHDVQRATPHRALVERASRRASRPGRASCWSDCVVFALAADVGAVIGTRDVAGIAGVEAVRAGRVDRIEGVDSTSVGDSVFSSEPSPVDGGGSRIAVSGRPTDELCDERWADDARAGSCWSQRYDPSRSLGCQRRNRGEKSGTRW
jgi:hypothetical protein